MALLSKDDSVRALKIISTVAVGYCVGGASYITYCSLPSAMTLDGKALKQFQGEVIKRSGPLPVFAITTITSSTLAYFLTENRSSEDHGWLCGSVIILLSLVPYSAYLLFPINGRFAKGELEEDEALPLMQTWRKCHIPRVVVYSGVFVYFCYLLSSRK